MCKGITMSQRNHHSRIYHDWKIHDFYLVFIFCFFVCHTHKTHTYGKGCESWSNKAVNTNSWISCVCECGRATTQYRNMWMNKSGCIHRSTFNALHSTGSSISSSNFVSYPNAVSAQIPLWHSKRANSNWIVTDLLSLRSLRRSRYLVRHEVRSNLWRTLYISSYSCHMSYLVYHIADLRGLCVGVIKEQRW